MDIANLIEVLNNKINTLLFEKNNAFVAGNIDRLTELEKEIATTNDTITKLQSIL